MMMAEHKHLAEQGVELVELRLDFIRRAVNLRRLLADRHCPVVATCRRKNEGGRWEHSESDRVMLLRTAIADGADYVDMEYDIADKIPRYGNTQRIISYHNFDETPDNLEEIHHRISEMDPDIIKIATMANNPIDNIKCLRLVRDSQIPTTAFCMGEMGLASRILCGRAGAPLTYATFSEERKMAPGQLTYTKMRDDFRYDSITKDTVILGVIADPVAHSLSPVVHNACIIEKGLDMLYLPFRVPKEYLEEFIKLCPELGVRGLSVTIPHKEKCLKCINVLDDNVAGIRAANTIVFKEVNAYGYNTDCTAAMTSLKNAIMEKHPDEKPFKDREFLVLGAGGVARAIAFGLTFRDAKVTICARDYRKSEDLANALDCKSVDWAARANHPTSVLVNCTPVGMHPNMDESPFEPDWFEKTVIVFDTVYTPERTLFIKQAREAGCTTITGVDMFVRQAAEQFKLFTGQVPNLETIRYELKRATSAARYDSAEAKRMYRAKNHKTTNLFLIGYRGSGKSTLAPMIAKKLDWKTTDSDDFIETNTKQKIVEIFDKSGEDGFRNLETKAIKKIAAKTKLVVSLGGGAPTISANRDLIKSRGAVVYLRGSWETLWERIKDDEANKDSRPDLTDEGGAEEVKKLVKRRGPIYEACADYTIDIDNESPQEIAARIVKWFQSDDKES